MPTRTTPLVTGKTYHVFNRTIDSKKVFADQSVCSLMLELLLYYRAIKTTISHSAYVKLKDQHRKDEIMEQILLKKNFRVEVLAYCLMPNHFHLLLKQKKDGGISKYISDVLNSLTRHLNIKSERKGPIFLPRFQSIHIVSTNQLNHTSRYIHLNPYSAGIVKTLSELVQYKYSSFPAYSSNINDLVCNTKFILSIFNDNKDSYKKFVLDNAEYQIEIEVIKAAIKKGK
ncbi:MAG: transposase [bacterium]|nr:transposase [bacterium]